MTDLTTQNDDFNKNIIAKEVESIMKDAYLEYALSVVVDRALPDARDGQKPVHRRILHAMNEMQIHYNKSYKKSARIVGDVIGKYHPHGDSSVYNAMVRMAQPFSMRMLIVDGQGNFGSVDGDNAAAMRYTEARMDKFSSKYMFRDIKKDTVDFIPNYDGEELEPNVLPVQIPFLLVNGVGGIAVGMASNIPPHNPVEVMDCVSYKVMNRINDKEDSIDELMQIMPSPDFPTGGHVHNLVSYRNAWEHGHAKFNLRAKWDEEDKNGRTTVYVREIPYQVNKAKLVENLEELTKVNPETKLAIVDGVSSILDCSDKEGTCIEIKIKPEYDSEIVMNQLVARSSLQTPNNYNCTVLVKENGKLIPKVCGINELFDQFIDHRVEIITRRTIFDNKKAQEREHILSALVKAIHPDMIDNVIATIKANKNQQDAKVALMDLLNVDENQAAAILEIRLARLTGMETERLEEELKEIEASLAYYNKILTDEKFLLNIIIKETDDIKTEMINSKVTTDLAYNNVKYPYRDRLSTYQIEPISTDLASCTKEENCNIILSSKGFVRRVPTSELSTMNRGSRGKKQIELAKDDSIQLSINSHSHANLLFITNKGQCYLVPAYTITDGIKGRHVNYIFDLSDKQNEKVINVLPVDFSNEDNLIAMFTKGGLVKLSKLDIYEGAKRKGGIKAVSLREGDSILSASVCTKEDEIFMVNSKNKIIRFSVDTVNVVGRTASGVKGMSLENKTEIVGAGCVSNDDGYIVCVSKNGLLKITKASQYRIQSRGGKGLAVMKTNERSGDLFTAFFADNLNDDIVTTTKLGYSNRRPLGEFNVTNRTTVGVKLVTLSDNDSLVDAFNSPHLEECLDDEIVDELIDEVCESVEETEVEINNVEETQEQELED